MQRSVLPKVVVATSAMLSFISFWRAAAVVLSDLASSAFYAGGIAEQAVFRHLRVSRAHLALGRDPRIVSAQHAWWFPENKDPGHGWDTSNINILTDNALEGCDPAMGASNIRTLLCRIYPESVRGAVS